MKDLMLAPVGVLVLLAMTLVTFAFGVFVVWAKRRLRAVVPDGCLGCNTKRVRASLLKNGVDPSFFHLMPPSRHKWSDIVPCPKCGRQWLVLPKEKRPS